MAVGGGAQGAAKQAASIARTLNGRNLEEIQTSSSGVLQLRITGATGFESVQDIDDTELKTVLSKIETRAAAAAGTAALPSL